MATTPARMQQRRRTAAQFASENPTLAAGEIGVVIDSVPDFKIGDGSTAWNSLTGFPELASSDPAKVPISTTSGVTTLDVEKTVPEFVRLTADSAAVNNSSTLVDITGLLVPVAANAVYIVTACIFYDSTSTADYQVAFSVPSGSTGRWNPMMIGPTAASPGVILVSAQDWGNARAGGGTGAILGMWANGVLITSSTAGNVQARHAQNTPEVSNTIACAHSWLTAQRIG